MSCVGRSVSSDALGPAMTTRRQLEHRQRPIGPAAARVRGRELRRGRGAGGVVVAWLVLVPLSALLYNAFTEDTGFGPGGVSLENFVEAYSSWHILGLLWNSLVFAVGTALTTLVMGALVAWVVERTDAPGGSLFHTLSLLSFAVPRLLIALAVRS